MDFHANALGGYFIHDIQPFQFTLINSQTFYYLNYLWWSALNVDVKVKKKFKDVKPMTYLFHSI